MDLSRIPQMDQKLDQSQLGDSDYCTGLANLVGWSSRVRSMQREKICGIGCQVGLGLRSRIGLEKVDRIRMSSKI